MLNTRHSLVLGVAGFLLLTGCAPRSDSRRGPDTGGVASSPPARVQPRDTAPPQAPPLPTGVDVSMVTSVGSGSGARLGTVAPGFSWKGSNGVERSLSDYRGKVLLINFWGTWCPPCRRELPDIVRLRDEYTGKGFEVIGVCLEHADDPLTVVSEFARKNDLRYPLVIASDDLPSAYGGIPAVPTTFVVNRTGMVVERLLGMQSAEVFRAAVDKAL